MAFQLAPIPSVGAVASRPRKEALIDTEVNDKSTSLRASQTLFANLTAFANTAGNATALTKTFPRDTSINGGQGGLPAAEHFYWYGWRFKIRTLNGALGTAANAVCFEEINRLRETTAVTFKYSTSDYIATQLDELPSGTGPQYANSTFTGVTVLSLPSGVPDRRNFKDVTVSGRPPEIQSLEQFRVRLDQTSGLYTPTSDYFMSCILDGLRLKGITG